MHHTGIIVSLVLSAAVLVLTCSGKSLAGTEAGTGIVGSPHDLIKKKGGTSRNACGYCHVPHSPAGVQTPLWGGTGQFSGLTAPLPGSGAGDAAGGESALQGPTAICLSCHEGTLATDRTGNAAGRGNRVSAHPRFDGSHPVGIDYTAAAAGKKGIKPATSRFLENRKEIKIQDKLFQGRIMTSATCHDVHNKDNVPNGPVNMLLYSPMSGSRICLSCHDF